MNPYYLVKPKSKKVPFLLSIPHCGTEIPVELKGQYKPRDCPRIGRYGLVFGSVV